MRRQFMMEMSIFENRHSSERFAWFLRSWRRAGGSFFVTFLTFWVARAGERFSVARVGEAVRNSLGIPSLQA